MSIKKAFIFTFKFLNDRKSIKEKKLIFIGFKSEPLSSLMYHSWIFKSINYVSHFITKMSKCYLSIFQMQYLHYTLGKITGCKYSFIDFEYTRNSRNPCGALFAICLTDRFWDYINPFIPMFSLKIYTCY